METLTNLLVREGLTSPQSVLASLHRILEPRFFLEIARKNVLQQFIGVAPLL